MQGKYLTFVNKCISFEECPSEIFPTMDNAAKGGGHIISNKLWFMEIDRWSNH